MSRIPLTHPARIFLECHVNITMQLIFNRPIVSCQHIEVGGFREILVAYIASDSHCYVVSVVNR